MGAWPTMTMLNQKYSKILRAAETKSIRVKWLLVNHLLNSKSMILIKVEWILQVVTLNSRIPSLLLLLNKFNRQSRWFLLPRNMMTLECFRQHQVLLNHLSPKDNPLTSNRNLIILNQTSSLKRKDRILKKMFHWICRY